MACRVRSVRRADYGRHGCDWIWRRVESDARRRPSRGPSGEPYARIRGDAKDRRHARESDVGSRRAAAGHVERQRPAVGRCLGRWNERWPDANLQPRGGNRHAPGSVPPPTTRGAARKRRRERQGAEPRRGRFQQIVNRNRPRTQSRGLMHTIVAFGFVLSAATTAVTAQDLLSNAKDQYAAAAYEDALATLTRVEQASPDVARQVEQYRVFCLFALGRTAEAETSAEAFMRSQPLARLDDASPRIEAMFLAVRKRLLPSLIRAEFRTARSALDEKNFPK